MIAEPSLAAGPRTATRSGTGRASRWRVVGAFLVLMVAPLAPVALASADPRALVRLPVESILVVLVLLVVSPAVGRVVAAVFAVVVVGAIVLAGLDLAFQTTLSRPFDPVGDAKAIGDGYGVVADALGAAGAIALLVLVAAVLVGAGLVLARCAIVVARVVRAAGRGGRAAMTGVAAAWAICALATLAAVPGVPLAAADTVATVETKSLQIAGGIRERAAFERALLSDPLGDGVLRGGGLLEKLQGKDVVIAFVESYGRVALEDPDISPGIRRVLAEAERRLQDEGYSARSAFLTSPTFGGVSWLAHATLHSGVWVDSQQKYDAVTESGRLTLARAFARGGWRTVAVVPSNDRDWDAGTTFYGFDAIHDLRALDYRGPVFGYARVPDQFTWRRFHDLELVEPHEPVMAEVDLVSSHTPWTPLPRLVPWDRLGDGSVFAAQAAAGPGPIEVWSDERRVRALYGQSLEYSLGATLSFLTSVEGRELVLVVLGDHQPSRIVSGARADHDVPVTIIAADRAVLAPFASAGWEPGLRPSPDAPVWRMDAFRDWFLATFSGE